MLRPHPWGDSGGQSGLWPTQVTNKSRGGRHGQGATAGAWTATWPALGPHSPCPSPNPGPHQSLAVSAHGCQLLPWCHLPEAFRPRPAFGSEFL